MSPKGDLISNMRRVVRFLQNFGGNSEDKRLLEEFTKMTSDFKGKLDLSKWLRNKYLPAGWRCKPNGNVILLKNPEGKVAHSFRQAMKLMVEDGRYSKEEMERLQQYPDGGKMYKYLMASTDGSRRKSMICLQCKKRFCDKNLLEKHTTKAHGAEGWSMSVANVLPKEGRSVICLKCWKCFFNRKGLKNHTKKEHGAEGWSFSEANLLPVAEQTVKMAMADGLRQDRNIANSEKRSPKKDSSTKTNCNRELIKEPSLGLWNLC